MTYAHPPQNCHLRAFALPVEVTDRGSGTAPYYYSQVSDHKTMLLAVLAYSLKKLLEYWLN
jgi:hypothetical protein